MDWRPGAESSHREGVGVMCRWMVYSGEPIPADALLFRPEHSIIDQSLHARLGGFTTNGDGFAIGWSRAPGGGGATPPGVKKRPPARRGQEPRPGPPVGRRP